MRIRILIRTTVVQIASVFSNTTNSIGSLNSPLDQRLFKKVRGSVVNAGFTTVYRNVKLRLGVVEFDLGQRSPKVMGLEDPN